MKGFGFKQLKRKEGPSFYLSGFKEKRKRNSQAISTLASLKRAAVVDNNEQLRV